MIHEEFIVKNNAIANWLEKLARATEHMAWLGTAHLANHRSAS